MPYRKTNFEKGYYYHLFNRGANRENIFCERDNYHFLLEKIKLYCEKDKVAMIAYCLMPNHYHFLLRQDDDTSLSVFMHSVFGSYTKAFNKKYQRTGTLFEDRFKSILIDSEEYLTHLCRYIHRNPIDGKKPLVDEISQWPFSNYLDWIGARNRNLVDRDFIQEHFTWVETYKDFVFEYEPDEKVVKKLEKYLFD